MKIPLQLVRFCAYGFLKNQRYFEPFMILAFLQKGLTFLQIGTLVAVREVTVQVLEIPSGAISDVWGRRRSMIASFLAYMASFGIFAWARGILPLAAGMILFGIGEAFRTGTHKAMIFSWLRAQGRLHERTRIYGLTRSWSKLGSAVSVVLAALFVLVSDSYVSVFYLSAVPYLLGIVNFLGYPPELDGNETIGHSSPIRHLWDTLRTMVATKGVRGLLLESMGFQGVFKATADYLQPVLEHGAAVLVGVAVLSGLGESQRTALVVAPVYFLLYLGSAWTSRKAHVIEGLAGSEPRAMFWLWVAFTGAFALLLPGAWFGIPGLMVVSFVALYLLQNTWRPILLARFDDYAAEDQEATFLSVESQIRRVATGALAPLLGWAVDWTSTHQPESRFWPVAAVGLLVGAVFVVHHRTRVTR